MGLSNLNLTNVNLEHDSIFEMIFSDRKRHEGYGTASNWLTGITGWQCTENTVCASETSNVRTVRGQPHNHVEHENVVMLDHLMLCNCYTMAVVKLATLACTCLYVHATSTCTCIRMSCTCLYTRFVSLTLSATSNATPLARELACNMCGNKKQNGNKLKNSNGYF